MAKYEDRLKDYVQVNERIIKFYEQYPTGSIQSEMVQLTDSLVVFKAFAYRHPDDAKPGVGHSSLGIPGTTPYTEGSEIENAETSAWGRALAALGFEVKRGIASRNEIENKEKPNGGVKVNPYIMDGDKPVPLEKSATLQQRAALWRTALSAYQGDKEAAEKWLAGRLEDLHVTKKTMTAEQVKLLTIELAEFAGKREHVVPTQENDIGF